MSRKIMHFLVLAALVAVTSVAMADPPARVGRVTVTEGRVTMLVDGEEETGNLMNWPVTSNNHLTTAPGARAEFRVGSTAVRLDGDSDIEVEQLDDERLRLRLNYGTASVRVRDPGMLNDFELLTPQARVTLPEPGAFRVDTERAPDTTVVNVFAGTARVEGAGNMLNARSGKRVEVRGDEIFTALAMRDAFDDWASNRDRRDERPIAARYVPLDMTGYEDLDQYGNWVDDREYGTVWFPRAVPVGWAPYRDGRWVWVSPWGWTWVDNSPWGYAPFHYGRWVTVGGRWCWTPGRVVGRPVWSPALVGWVGGNNWSVSFSSGRPAAPAVGWYPLTPRDRYVPAYRVSADVERRLIWNHRTNEHWHERFQDRDRDGRRDGVTALPRDQFDRGRQIPVNNVARVTPQDVRNVPQMATPPQVTMAPNRPVQWNRDGRDERGNRDRFDRNDRGQDRRAEQQRQPMLQTQPQVQSQQQSQPQQLQLAPQRQIRTDSDEHESWRGRNARDEQRRQMTTTSPQQQQPVQLQAAPSQMQQQQLQQQQRMDQQRAEQQRMEQQQRAEQQQREEQQRRMEQQQRNEQRMEARDRGGRMEAEERRREAAQMQAAQARQQQASPPPQLQAAPVQQSQPQQQQRREQAEKRHEQRNDKREDNNR